MEEKKLGYYFKTMTNEMIRNRNKDLEKLGLTSTQADVLMYLLKDETEKNQRDIEQFFGLSNPTVSGILNRLELKEFIQRKQSIKDSRSKSIIPTQKSLDLNKKMRNKMKNLEKQLLNGISEEELQVFRNVAKKLHDNILGTRKDETNERNI